eukprot:TRINITY_DN8720_c0_g1_i1.p1 TRINITY_DN8720_c0_g1~~TRINITY_DN8720_c0_g1_i1.p1  ORF type:complete len:420 (+),score=103.32 TRINITY_DN8720_c0_g1_i1:426-1685(+)
MKALKKLPDEKKEVYRGLRVPLTQLSKLYTRNSLVIWVAFTSTSLDSQLIKTFCTADAGTWMILEVIEGKDIRSFSLFKEEEFLLLPNAHFRVKDIMSNQMRKIVGIPENIDVLHLVQEPTPKEDKFEFEESELPFDVCLELYDFDPIWAEKFEEEKQRMVDAGVPDVRIDHVGSTSVNDMIAKPYVDIGIRSYFGSSEFQNHVKILTDLGYKPLNQLTGNLNNGIMFLELSKVGSFRGYFVHLSPVVSVYSLVAFRDLLRRDDKRRNEYKILKMNLSQSCTTFKSYTLGKTQFVWSNVVNDGSCEVKSIMDLVWKEDYESLKDLLESNPMLAVNMYVLDSYITLLGVLLERNTPSSKEMAKVLVKYGARVTGRSCGYGTVELLQWIEQGIDLVARKSHYGKELLSTNTTYFNEFPILD